MTSSPPVLQPTDQLHDLPSTQTIVGRQEGRNRGNSVTYHSLSAGRGTEAGLPWLPEAHPLIESVNVDYGLHNPASCQVTYHPTNSTNNQLHLQPSKQNDGRRARWMEGKMDGIPSCGCVGEVLIDDYFSSTRPGVFSLLREQICKEHKWAI